LQNDISYPNAPPNLKRNYLVRLPLFVSVIALAAPAFAADKEDENPNADIVVTARKLDQARDSISTSIGASQYRFDREALDLQPGGADRSLKGVLLQAPGVTQDSDGDGDVHIRNEHGNVQYRLNGIIIPESLAGFGSIVDPRVASSVEVITGALPAQYGNRTAGIVSLTTRTDAFDFDGDVGVYGGGNSTVQPSATIRNSVGPLNYFFSASLLKNDHGISNPLPTKNAIHDKTTQYRGFGYVSYILNDTSRLTAFGGTSIGRFQIPNSVGAAPAFTYNGRTQFDSTQLDQNQRQKTYFGVAAWQYAGDTLDLQIAPFVRYAKAHYTPDPAGGQLIFNGSDTDLTQDNLAYGVQSDASLKLGDAHTARFGLYFQRERTGSNSLTRVFPVDALGAQVSDLARSVALSQSKVGRVFGVYLQDEWRIGDTLTLNYGLRYDHVSAFVREQQVSPRAGLVWKPVSGTTVHLGYARNFTPPPQELIANSTVTAFAGTTAAAPTAIADPVRAEREHNVDFGVQQVIAGRLTLGFDAYYKTKQNLLDEEHFGSTLIQSPFNYAKANVWGVEFSANYEHGPLEFYVNLARGQEKAKQIVSNQFFFDAAELGYIANTYIYTDHSQKWTISGGGALKLPTPLGQLTPSFDFIYGDGLRAGDPNGIIPNGGKQKPYLQVNFGAALIIGGDAEDKNISIRFDIVNLFDKIYLIHDGSGVGAGQAEYGPRRTLFVGVRKAF
jgi:outer membrane receptor protein involved in Fe transport